MITLILAITRRTKMAKDYLQLSKVLFTARILSLKQMLNNLWILHPSVSSFSPKNNIKRHRMREQDKSFFLFYSKWQSIIYSKVLFTARILSLKQMLKNLWILHTSVSFFSPKNDTKKAVTLDSATYTNTDNEDWPSSGHNLHYQS